MEARSQPRHPVGVRGGVGSAPSPRDLALGGRTPRAHGSALEGRRPLPPTHQPLSHSLTLIAPPASLPCPPLPPSPSPASLLGPPSHLPQLQICSSLSRWLRGRREAAPSPSALPSSPRLTSPTPFRLSQSRRLIMHFTDEGRGLWRSPSHPRCRPWPPPRASRTQTGGTQCHPGAKPQGTVFSSTSDLFLLVFFHVKLVQHGSGQGLLWVWAGASRPFPGWKGDREEPTHPLQSLATAVLFCPTPISLTSRLSLGTIYRLLIF